MHPRTPRLLAALVVAQFIGLVSLPCDTAYAIGDASTRFSIYVPPNNASTSRRSLLVVTSISPTTNAVTVMDDDLDGDDDDSAVVSLARGQSYVVRIADGAVNDDIGGRADGDYFHIQAEHPVVVQLATTSNWQHDWLPSEGGGSRGRSFFVYSPPTSGADSDLNVYAYEDDTRVTVTEISTATTTSGLSAIDLDAGTPVLDVLLQQGEDLIVRENRLGLDILDPGRTYWVQATRPVTAQYGHLGQVTGGNQARDGAGYVPSANGSTSGSLFYFSIPHNPGRASEKELRITCFADNTTVELYGATRESAAWTLLSSSVVDAGGHLDFVGASDPAFRDHDLYQLRTVPAYQPCNVFEGNWMETGSFGTSDFATAVASEGGDNIGHRFYAYIGPPGRQENVRHPVGEQTNLSFAPDGYYAHLYVYSFYDGANVTATDVDTAGSVFTQSFEIDAGEYYDLVIDRSTYRAMSRDGRRPYVRLDAAQPVVVVNGNFNDNWMAFLHSSVPSVPIAEVTATSTDLACGATTVITVDCQNPSSLSLDSLTATLTIPAGMQVRSTGSGTLSADGRTLSFAGSPLGAGSMQSFGATLERDCSTGSCSAASLTALTAECRAQSAGVPYAATATLPLEPRSPVEMTAFTVRDIPDYVATPPEPRVAVEFTLDGVGSPTVRLVRATSDGDADAPSSTLTTLNPVLTGTPTSFLVEDPYALHYERTRFYRLEVEEGGCLRTLGPVAVTTSSGGSGGEASGLESDGSLGIAVARRELSHSALGGAMVDAMVDAEATLGTALAGLEDRPLEAMLPITGPGQTRALTVTPTDLLALTNAWDVASADYLDEVGTRVASVLLLETQGEVYDHQKTLCDRAGGAHIDFVDVRGYAASDGGAWLRTALRNPSTNTGEVAIEVKLYAQADGTYQAYSRWLRTHYPEPEPGQRILNIQVWSTRPGLEISLLEDVLAPLDVHWPEPATPPSAYVEHAGTLGGEIALSIVSTEPHSPTLQSLTMHATFVGEDGLVRELALGGTASERSRFSLPEAFLDVTLDLRDETGRTVDSVWMSDGAWAPYDDSMWGGSSETNRFEPYDCQLGETRSRDSLALSGCAAVEARVEERAGVARHLGGAYAPLAMNEWQALTFTATSSAPIEVCIETEAQGPRTAHCTEVEGASEPTRYRVPLSELRADRCPAVSEVALAHLITFSVRQRGEHTLVVDDLGLVPATDRADTNGADTNGAGTNGANTNGTLCQTPSSRGEAGFGCQVGQPSHSGLRGPFLALLGLLMTVVWRRTGGRD